MRGKKKNVKKKDEFRPCQLQAGSISGKPKGKKNSTPMWRYATNRRVGSLCVVVGVVNKKKMRVEN